MLQIKANRCRVLNQLNQILKNDESALKYDLKKIAYSSINKGYLKGKQIRRVIFYLRSKGCAWCTTKSGGCFMCGHYHGTTKGKNFPLDLMSHYEQFISEFKKYDFSKFPMICIYNAGSLLNHDELSEENFTRILSTINENPHIKHVIIESRPEFINNDILTRINKLIKDKTIEIGIGLETTSDKIRSLCINKGFNFSEYRSAVELIKHHKLNVLTYLTVKPIFLTISESIYDIVKSINDICSITDVISLEPTSIQNGTLVDFFFQRGLYSIPKGWMIRDILCEIEEVIKYNAVELRIGGFEFYPIPDFVISNCPQCNDSLYRAIDRYNTTKDLGELEMLKCSCEYQYNKNILNEDEQIGNISLEERISRLLALELSKSPVNTYE